MVKQSNSHSFLGLMLISFVLITCERFDIVRIVKVETLPVTSYTSTTAVLPGNIIDPGEGIKECGHYWWAEGKNPVKMTGSHTDKGIYTSVLTGLQPSITYYAIAYGTDRKEVITGQEVFFTTLKETGTFIDGRDGHEYQWVKIGNQVWMAENLVYLPAVSPPTAGSYSEPYYYVQGYEGSSVSTAKATSNYATYGVLYNWPAAMNGEASTNANLSRVQGVCPDSWHLPSDAEWTKLTDCLGGESFAGGKLKEAGYTHWYSPNTGADNRSGFTALPGGFLIGGVGFGGVGDNVYWWSATEGDAASAWGRNIYLGSGHVDRYCCDKDDGFSVRCVRDN